MASYSVETVEALADPIRTAELDATGYSHAVVRHSFGDRKTIWSFHKTEALAKRAMSGAKNREIVTR